MIDGKQVIVTEANVKNAPPARKLSVNSYPHLGSKLRKQIGAKLQEARELRGWSRRRLANVLAWSVSSIRTCENGAFHHLDKTTVDGCFRYLGLQELLVEVVE